MRRATFVFAAFLGLSGAAAKAQGVQAIIDRDPVWQRLNTNNRTYSPVYGYSNRLGYSYRGNSAPFQGDFTFPPGYGYGSIYGNSGHPGFNRFTGPAWASPYAWGRP